MPDKTVREIIRSYKKKIVYHIREATLTSTQEEVIEDEFLLAIKSLLMEAAGNDKQQSIEEIERYNKCDGTPREWTEGMVYGYNVAKAEIRQAIERIL